MKKADIDLLNSYLFGATKAEEESAVLRARIADATAKAEEANAILHKTYYTGAFPVLEGVARAQKEIRDLLAILKGGE